MRNKAMALQKHPTSDLAFPPMEEDRNAPSPAVKDRSPNHSASAYWGADDAAGRPIHRILVPTDFSPSSARALECAIAMPRQSDASLTILHVIDINPPAASRHFGTADDLMRQLWVRGTSEFAGLKTSLDQTQVRIQTLLVEGLPFEAIVENSCDFDLLVIYEPSFKSAWNFFSRHTARRVIEQAKCPVHVVRQETGLATLDIPSKTRVAA
jgi:nucleotide-binding universal stress UspA family protein